MDLEYWHDHIQPLELGVMLANEYTISSTELNKWIANPNYDFLLLSYQAVEQKEVGPIACSTAVRSLEAIFACLGLDTTRQQLIVHAAQPNIFIPTGSHNSHKGKSVAEIYQAEFNRIYEILNFNNAFGTINCIIPQNFTNSWLRLLLYAHDTRTELSHFEHFLQKQDASRGVVITTLPHATRTRVLAKELGLNDRLSIIAAEVILHELGYIHTDEFYLILNQLKQFGMGELTKLEIIDALNWIPNPGLPMQHFVHFMELINRKEWLFGVTKQENLHTSYQAMINQKIEKQIISKFMPTK